MEITTGVVVAGVEPGSPAAEAEIRKGDVIQEVDRKPVKNVEDFEEAMETAKHRENILFLVRRGDSNLFVVVTRE